MARKPLVEGRFVKPYALLRPRLRQRTEQLLLNTAATQQCGLVAKMRVDLEWEADEFMLIVKKNGHQRSVRSQHGWSAICVTNLLRKYDIPLHRHPLPIYDVIGDEIWIDLTGEQALGSFNTMSQGPYQLPKLQSQKRARLSATVRQWKISVRAHPELAELCQTVYEIEKEAEEVETFSDWVERALGYYVEHQYGELWEEWLKQHRFKSG